ncbi:hypothetical protein C8Q76DRAFT_800343 [Earliella scabrosa]|nr:hypothetical protein C8Q76DRAFT_800343 [Earliella scabrosa]
MAGPLPNAADVAPWQAASPPPLPHESYPTHPSQRHELQMHSTITEPPPVQHHPLSSPLPSPPAHAEPYSSRRASRAGPSSSRPRKLVKLVARVASSSPPIRIAFWTVACLAIPSLAALFLALLGGRLARLASRYSDIGLGKLASLAFLMGLLLGVPAALAAACRAYLTRTRVIVRPSGQDVKRVLSRLPFSPDKEVQSTAHREGELRRRSWGRTLLLGYVGLAGVVAVPASAAAFRPSGLRGTDGLVVVLAAFGAVGMSSFHKTPPGELRIRHTPPSVSYGSGTLSTRTTGLDMWRTLHEPPHTNPQDPGHMPGGFTDTASASSSSRSPSLATTSPTSSLYTPNHDRPSSVYSNDTIRGHVGSGYSTRDMSAYGVHQGYWQRDDGSSGFSIGDDEDDEDDGSPIREDSPTGLGGVRRRDRSLEIQIKHVGNAHTPIVTEPSDVNTPAQSEAGEHYPQSDMTEIPLGIHDQGPSGTGPDRRDALRPNRGTPSPPIVVDNDIPFGTRDQGPSGTGPNPREVLQTNHRTPPIVVDNYLTHRDRTTQSCLPTKRRGLVLVVLLVAWFIFPPSLSLLLLAVGFSLSGVYARHVPFWDSARVALPTAFLFAFIACVLWCLSITLLTRCGGRRLGEEEKRPFWRALRDTMLRRRSAMVVVSLCILSAIAGLPAGLAMFRRQPSLEPLDGLVINVAGVGLLAPFAVLGVCVAGMARKD